jgi:predicted Rossmann fold nucleotide-binding protein DprA/Smf involved in DNA uptake
MPGKLTDAQKLALKLFRESHGGIAEPLKQHVSRARQQRKQLTDALQAGPATVPELAQKTGLPADEVLWQVAGMRKYGLAREAAQDGDYVKYELATQ